jgi:hypothetical protein
MNADPAARGTYKKKRANPRKSAAKKKINKNEVT